MNLLTEILRRRIDVEGPLTVAEYMTAVLLHPEHGYYVRKDPFGTDGDFMTAPEISQMFGELIGLWCAVTWRQLGSPSPVALVELGPGRGTLMADALRALELAPDFLECVDVRLVEASPVLRSRQREALSDYTVSWHDGVEDIPDGAAVLVANEFLDALPIRQLVRRDGAWHERLIAWGDDGFRFVLDPEASPLAALLPDTLREGSHNGEIAEVSPAVLGLARTAASRIARDGGAALFIDYGHKESALGESLQAVRDHAFAGVLADPGSADLTAHVDFGAFARAAGNALVHGPVEQGVFLERLGIGERSRKLMQSASPRLRKEIEASHRRLTDPTEMGQLFKVVAFTRLSAPPPPGFEAP